MLALAGLAAHDGHLRLEAVIAVAAVAGFAGDQLFFWLGRTCEAPLRRRFPRLFAHAPRLERLTARWHAWVIVLVRFAYGLRIAGPILLGTTRLPAARFALFNAIGALLWAHLVALAGWFLGAALESWLGKLQRAEHWLVIGALLVALPWLLHRWRRAPACRAVGPRRRSRQLVRVQPVASPATRRLRSAASATPAVK